jgi:hypothetical protein
MVNSKHYTNNILELFFRMLTEEEKQHVNFQQHNTTADTSQHFIGFSTNFLVKEKLEADYGHLIRQIWVCAIFMSGELEAKSVQEQSPHSEAI